MKREYENYVTEEFQMISEGAARGEPRVCWKCGREESEEYPFEYHQSDYHRERYGLGVWVDSGCHKQLHKNEKRAITMAAKKAAEEEKD